MDSTLMQLMSDPAVLGSLQNTLTPAGLLSQYDALIQKQNEENAARTKAATEAATAAGTAYQQAAAAPPPQLDPLAQSLPQLLGNVGSALTGNQGYSQRAHQSVQQQQQSLLDARIQNLTALRDRYDTTARAAAAAGNYEMEQKARGDLEKLDKTLQVVMKTRDEQFQIQRDTERGQQSLREIAAQGKEARMTEGVRHAGDMAEIAARNKTAVSDYMDSLVHETIDGHRWLDMTNVPPKAKEQAMQYAKANGLVAVNKDEAQRLQTFDEVMGSISDVESVMNDILPKEEGAARFRQGAKNIMSRVLQKHGQVAAFDNTSVEGIRVIQGLAAGAGSGFRLNQSEINMITKRWPQITDALPTARWKLFWDKRFLVNKQRAFFGLPKLPMPKYEDIASGKYDGFDPAAWDAAQSGNVDTGSSGSVRRYDAQGNLIGGK